MQNLQDFEKKFQKIYTAMIELAYEYVNRNKEEIDEVYVFGSIEKGYFYKAFYKINGILVKSHRTNTISKEQYDISDNRTFAMLKIGNTYLSEIEQLFEEYNQEVPTILKFIYSPKTGKFDSKFEYGLKFTNHETKTPQDIYEEWYNSLVKTSSQEK